jgi:hypothetical protein
MSTGHIILIVVFAVIALLAIGGAIGATRRRRAREHNFAAVIDDANRKLADAHAEDKGWEPNHLETEARRLFAEREPAAEIVAVALVQVIDEPGTDQDKAVFRFTTATGVKHLTLGRSGGDWVAEGVV